MEYLIYDQDEKDINRAFKYPQLASDILSTSNPQILEFFLTKDKNEVLINFNKLFEEFFEEKEKIKDKLINYT